MPEGIKKLLLDMAGETGLFSFLLMCIAAPILEELLFRGIMLDGLLKKYSPIKSILISSFLFGFVHLNPWQFVTGFIIGIFAGWVYYKSRSLSFAILIHATANLSGFLLGCFGNFDSSTMNETLVESYGNVLNLTLAIIGSVLATVICIYFLNKEFKVKIDKNGST